MQRIALNFNPVLRQLPAHILEAVNYLLIHARTLDTLARNVQMDGFVPPLKQHHRVVLVALVGHVDIVAEVGFVFRIQLVDLDL